MCVCFLDNNDMADANVLFANSTYLRNDHARRVAFESQPEQRALRQPPARVRLQGDSGRARAGELHCVRDDTSSGLRGDQSDAGRRGKVVRVRRRE